MQPLSAVSLAQVKECLVLSSVMTQKKFLKWLVNAQNLALLSRTQIAHTWSEWTVGSTI